jgi:hypothetical protein
VFWPFWIYISIYLILSLTSIVLFTISLLKYCSLLLSGGEIDVNQIRQQDFNGMSRRRNARQMLLGRGSNHASHLGTSSRSEPLQPRANDMDPEEAEIMFQLTNDLEFAVSYFKVKRKINLMSSLWLLIVTTFGTFVAIMFVYLLGQYLDTVAEGSSH